MNTHLEGCEYQIRTDEIKCIVGKPDFIFNDEELDEDVLLIPDENNSVKIDINLVSQQITIHREDEVDSYEALQFNTVLLCEGVYFAIRAVTDESWCEEVLNFSIISPKAKVTSDTMLETQKNGISEKYSWNKFTFFRISIAALMIILAVNVGLYVHQQVSERQEAKLLDVLGGNRFDYRVFWGGDDKQYVIARSDHAKVWAARSLIASGRNDEVTLLSEPKEVDRIASYLNVHFQNMKFHLIRFEDPSYPEIVLSKERSRINERLKEEVNKALKKNWPWIKNIKFSSVSDKIVEVSAITGLKKLGLPFEPQRSLDVLTFTFRGEVNDSELNKLKIFTREFERQWQGRFIRFNMQLQNNFLADKSYSYGSDGYIKLNTKHWFFAEPQV